MYMDDTNLQEQLNRRQEKPAIGHFLFFTKERRDLETGQLIAEDWVSWMKVGDRYDSRTFEKIARLQGNPAKGKQPMIEWLVIEPHYDAWKQGVERAADGTALSDWRGVDDSLVEVLKAQKVATVEEFAAYPDHLVGSFKYPNIHKWHKLAKDYVKDSAGREALKAELDSRDEMIAELMKRLESVEAAKTDDGPKKRGRPPKVDKQDEGEQAA